MRRTLQVRWLLYFGCAAAFGQTTNPFAGNADAAAAGAELFQARCSNCHGKGGRTGRAPDLTAGFFSVGDQDSDLFRTIANGIPGTEMNGFEKRLDADKIWRIITFLRSATRNQPPLTGDAAHGEALFWGKGGCGGCHAAANRGNRLGPDLSRIGRQRSIPYLRESLVDPSADVLPNYGGLTVVTRDGKTIRGLERSLDDFSAVLQDFSGKAYSFDRADLRSVTRDTRSLMPEYGKVFSDTELNDLLTYLATLGKSEVKP